MKKLSSVPYQSPGRELSLSEADKESAGHAIRSAFMEADVSLLLSLFAGEIVLIPMQSTG